MRPEDSQPIEKLRRLVALATDSGTSEEERKTVAVVACREMIRLGMMSQLPSREEALSKCRKIVSESKTFDLLGFLYQTALGKKIVNRIVEERSLPKDVYPNTFDSDFSFK